MSGLGRLWATPMLLCGKKTNKQDHASCSPSREDSISSSISHISVTEASLKHQTGVDPVSESVSQASCGTGGEPDTHSSDTKNVHTLDHDPAKEPRLHFLSGVDPVSESVSQASCGTRGEPDTHSNADPTNKQVSTNLLEVFSRSKAFKSKTEKINKQDHASCSPSREDSISSSTSHISVTEASPKHQTGVDPVSESVSQASCGTRGEPDTHSSDAKNVHTLDHDPAKEPRLHFLNDPVRQGSEKIFNIVLVGQTGSGKSASANTILAAVKSEEVTPFRSELSSLPVTTQCDFRILNASSGMQIRLVDTPDFLHEFVQNCQKHIEECKKYCEQDLCMVLLVLQLSRLTDGEKEILEKLEEKFGCPIKKKTMVLFTHGDDLKKEQRNPHQFIQENKSLTDIITSCNGQYQVFNNMSKSYKQVHELFGKIQKFDYFPELKKTKFPFDCFLL
ncbi:uncharacterized protein KZ484_021132 [Pholidichthys leucotaenia]